MYIREGIAGGNGESYHCDEICSLLRAPRDAKRVEGRCCGHNGPYEVCFNKN